MKNVNNIQIEINSLFYETDDIVGPKNSLMIEVDDVFAEVNAESKFGIAEVQDADVAKFAANDIENEMRDIRHLLECKAKTGGQGSKSKCDQCRCV